LAYALYYTGSFAEALEETTRASEEFAGCLVNEYDLARLGIVRALVLRALERWSEALAAAEDSVRAFAEFSDIEREASARIAEAHLLFSMREFEKAVRTLSDREEVLRATSHAETHARVLMNLGYAYWQMGRTSEGMGYYDAATEIFRGLGIRTEALRIQWAVARMLRESGHASMSLEKSRNIASQFEELGMTSEWALVSLDIAEIILDEQKFDEVEAICRAAIGAFERAGVSYTAKALTALAYMREATRNKTITAPLVRQVREYIRRLPIDGELLFIPLP
jgi:tetratricopeptide (TPR) repeat protein